MRITYIHIRRCLSHGDLKRWEQMWIYAQCGRREYWLGWLRKRTPVGINTV
jgi:hypothetical protein